MLEEGSDGLPGTPGSSWKSMHAASVPVLHGKSRLQAGQTPRRARVHVDHRSGVKCCTEPTWAHPVPRRLLAADMKDQVSEGAERRRVVSQRDKVGVTPRGLMKARGPVFVEGVVQGRHTRLLRGVPPRIEGFGVSLQVGERKRKESIANIPVSARDSNRARGRRQIDASCSCCLIRLHAS